MSRKKLLFTRCYAKNQHRNNHFSHFPMSQQTYTTKISIFLQIHIGLSQQQHHPENKRRISHGQPTITRKRPEIMEMMVSWKRFTNRTERDFEEESLFEDIICYDLYLIVGVIYVSFRIQSGSTMFLRVYIL